MNARTTQADRGRGPTRLGLVALALSAFALLATTAPIPTLRGAVLGEVAIGGGESVERELRIHVDPRGGGAVSGSIRTSFQAASGLADAYTDDVTITPVAASDAAGSFDASTTFPVERCATGCDLTYRLRIAAAPGVLPGSVVRYEVEVELVFGQSGPSRDPGLMRVDLDGAASGPVASVWSLLAGLLALVVGLALGPGVGRALTLRRRDWPARGLVALAIGLAGWVIVSDAISLVSRFPIERLLSSPTVIVAIADPWSVGLFGVLVWGIWRGVRRWPVDGGWLLGMAAVALTGLGGLWFAWWSTIGVAVQPIALAIPFVALGSLGGIVIGQAWRTEPAARHDRWWAAFAVLGHGIVIAGFAFIAEQFLYDPFSAAPTSLLALIPATVVTLAFYRWLGGGRRWLILFDLITAIVGLVGLWFLAAVSTLGASSVGVGVFGIGQVAVALATVAAMIAFGTALHRMPGPQGLDPPDPGAIPAPPEVPTVSLPDPPDGVRSTT